MNVICLQEEAFYELVETVVDRLKKDDNIEDAPRWIAGKDCMKLLGIKSKTTLQKLRDDGEIRFSKPSGKIILYDRQSIDDYLNSNAHDTY